eukprot:354149-Chlamydomonas_euryale.AAC.6
MRFSGPTAGGRPRQHACRGRGHVPVGLAAHASACSCTGAADSAVGIPQVESSTQIRCPEHRPCRPKLYQRCIGVSADACKSVHMSRCGGDARNVRRVNLPIHPHALWAGPSPESQKYVTADGVWPIDVRKQTQRPTGASSAAGSSQHLNPLQPPNNAPASTPRAGRADRAPAVTSGVSRLRAVGTATPSCAATSHDAAQPGASLLFFRCASSRTTDAPRRSTSRYQATSSRGAPRRRRPSVGRACGYSASSWPPTQLVSSWPPPSAGKLTDSALPRRARAAKSRGTADRGRPPRCRRTARRTPLRTVSAEAARAGGGARPAAAAAEWGGGEGEIAWQSRRPVPLPRSQAGRAHKEAPTDNPLRPRKSPAPDAPSATPARGAGCAEFMCSSGH